ncbi:MAG: DUF4056 domain-containing protein [Cytophagaceae bacterium]|nr:DUF4056 domain-containing protein [Cytophagaceae bacterium]
MKLLQIWLLITVFFTSSFAKPPHISNIKNPPPRIIRTCCGFGAEVPLAGLTFIKVSDITSGEKIGEHKFMGSKHENNGIVYTKKGGFIDMGHLRDIADITAYMYVLMKSEPSPITLKLGNEGGQKVLKIDVPSNFQEQDYIHLAGKIAYDLSVWHEVSTWYGASYIPLVPERYSSFSVEDAYSNLTGVQLGMRALASEKEYEIAMTENVTELLNGLEVVETLEKNYEAMNAVKDLWWSGKAKYPSRKVLIKRVYDIYGCIYPLLIDDIQASIGADNEVCVPEKTVSGEDLNKFYRLNIKTNFKIPVKKALENQEKMISQLDFPALIEFAKEQAEAKEKHKDLR